ncbi:MAG: nickel insertion protein, partial [Vicinamibacterales bacterium]
TLITVLAPPDRREALGAIIFRETTTIGLRWHTAERERLVREIVQVHTPHGPARVKLARRAGAVINAAPEFDDCARLAAVAGVSVKDAHALVMKAYLDQA